MAPAEMDGSFVPEERVEDVLLVTGSAVLSRGELLEERDKLGLFR